jgi:CRISPR-associated protein Csm2
MVHMLTAKAAYAKGRDLISDSFLAFIKGSVSQIRDTKDLRIFATFFEAVMGFYRQLGPSN